MPPNSSSALSITQARKAVIKIVRQTAYRSMLAFIKEQQPNFWATEQHWNFSALVAFLYMNIENLSYDTMICLCSKWRIGSKRSFEHNCMIIGGVLTTWSKKQISLGGIND
jgi:hypothetical protein